MRQKHPYCNWSIGEFRIPYHKTHKIRNIIIKSQLLDSELYILHSTKTRFIGGGTVVQLAKDGVDLTELAPDTDETGGTVLRVVNNG